MPLAARLGCPAASSPEPSNRGRLDARRGVGIGQTQCAVGPVDQFVTAATDQRVQHMTLRDQRRGVGVPFGIHDVPGPTEPNVRFGRAAAQDRQVRQHRVAQWGFAEALHRRDLCGRGHAVTGGDQRVDRSGQALVVQ